MATVIAELMPLPSRNVSEWIYSTIADIPALTTREAYIKEYRPLRVRLLRAAIETAKPNAVVFLGLTAIDSWAEVVDAPFTSESGAFWATSGRTRGVVVKHPTAFGAKNEYFESIGRTLAA